MNRCVAHWLHHLAMGVLLVLVGVCFDRLHQYHHGGTR